MFTASFSLHSMLFCIDLFKNIRILQTFNVPVSAKAIQLRLLFKGAMQQPRIDSLFCWRASFRTHSGSQKRKNLLIYRIVWRLLLKAKYFTQDFIHKLFVDPSKNMNEVLILQNKIKMKNGLRGKTHEIHNPFYEFARNELVGALLFLHCAPEILIWDVFGGCWGSPKIAQTS